mmetsp:Transcript_78045/g.155120  ORF Transcript_78045/g.155120 Transcript_78045/m.155120 type:complete len:240 (-) Transcript_78045:938-1657(-)
MPPRCARAPDCCRTSTRSSDPLTRQASALHGLCTTRFRRRVPPIRPAWIQCSARSPVAGSIFSAQISWWRRSRLPPRAPTRAAHRRRTRLVVFLEWTCGCHPAHGPRYTRGGFSLVQRPPPARSTCSTCPSTRALAPSCRAGRPRCRTAAWWASPAAAMMLLSGRSSLALRAALALCTKTTARRSTISAETCRGRTAPMSSLLPRRCASPSRAPMGLSPACLRCVRTRCAFPTSAHLMR